MRVVNDRVVVVSDLHIHPFRLCSRDGGRDRLNDGLSALEQSFKLAEKHDATWLFAGDIKQPKWVWPQEALTGALELFRKYRHVSKLMIPGNHDGDVSMIGGSGLSPFADLATVVQDVRVVDGILCVPAGHHDRIEQSHLMGAEFVCGHAFLSGVMLGLEDIRIERDILPETFDIGGDYLRAGFFGDIHKGQALRKRDGKPPAWEAYPKTALPGSHLRIREPLEWRCEVFYPGSPYMQNWGERNDGVKGVLLVDLRSGTVDLYPIEAPRYYEVVWESLAFDKIEGILSQAEQWSGHFVRILAGEWVERGAAKDVVERIRARADARYFRVIPLPKEEKRGKEAPLHAGMEPDKMLEGYVDARPLSGVSGATVLRAGLRLYHQP